MAVSIPQGVEEVNDLRQIRKLHGECPYCGTSIVGTGYVACETCRKKSSRLAKRRYRNRKALGQCKLCESDVVPGHAKCAYHLETQNEYNDNRAACLERDGICKRCGKVRVRHYKTCARCRKVEAAARKRRNPKPRYEKFSRPKWDKARRKQLYDAGKCTRCAHTREDREYSTCRGCREASKAGYAKKAGTQTVCPAAG